ncbi:MAG: hypothetical protein JO370_13375 [Paucibacter sp.]|nr:hypothetical protein [Roseateles sp.]
MTKAEAMKKTLRAALWAMVATIVVQTGMTHAVLALLLGKLPLGRLESSGRTAWAIDGAIALAAALAFVLVLGWFISLYRTKRSTHR